MTRTRKPIDPVPDLETTGFLAHGLPAWKVSGPRGSVTYLMGGGLLLFDPTWSHSAVVVDSRAHEVQAHAILSHDNQVLQLLADHYRQMPAGPPDWPATAKDWLNLDPADLVAALTRCRWYPRVDNTIGGWCVMPANLPPSSGIPTVGAFLGETIAETVCREHNAFLPDATIGDKT